MTKKENNKENEKKPTQISFIEFENKLIEQCYKEGEGVCFVVWDEKELTYKKSVKINNIVYEPIYGDDVTKRVVLLPSEPKDYKDEDALVQEIENFIRKWLGVNEEYYKIATWYILTTWVYDRFDTINYLRALGDTGSGKSRFLDVIGGLCYKFTLISGAVTPAPVFRLLEKWKGTLGIEEADLKESDETNEIIKILNCGFERQKPVIRCDKNFPDKLQYFDCFGPKVIATRKEFYDQAIEARCLTEIMMEDATKPDTKTEGFYKERIELRNKLLMFRFRNYHKVNISNVLDIDLGMLEPRLRQASRAFLALIWDKPELLDKFKVFLKDYNQKLIEQRASSYQGIIINSIAKILIEKGEDNLSPTEIALETEVEKITNIIVSKIIRGLGLRFLPKKVSGKTKRILIIEHRLLNILFRRYIYDQDLLEILVTKGYGKVTQVTLVTATTGKAEIINNDKVVSKDDKPMDTPIDRNLRNRVTEAPQKNQPKNTKPILSKLDIVYYVRCNICSNTSIKGCRYEIEGKLICDDCAKDYLGS